MRIRLLAKNYREEGTLFRRRALVCAVGKPVVMRNSATKIRKTDHELVDELQNDD